MRRTALVVSIVGITAGFVLAPALPAFAHNYVVSSTPAEGETLSAVPEFFTITTNESMLDLSGAGAGFAIQVTDDSGLFYGDGCVTVQGTTISMPGALGAAGAYTMTYQYVSADGHTLSDALAFSFAPADGALVQEGRATAPVCGEVVEEPSAPPSAPPSAAPSESATAQPEVDETAATDAGDESSTVLAIAAGIGAAVLVVGGLLGLGVWRGRREPGGSAGNGDTAGNGGSSG